MVGSRSIGLMAATMVASRPSSTQVTPRATTSSQWKRPQGRRSRRAGMSVSTPTAGRASLLRDLQEAHGTPGESGIAPPAIAAPLGRFQCLSPVFGFASRLNDQVAGLLIRARPLRPETCSARAPPPGCTLAPAPSTSGRSPRQNGNLPSRSTSPIDTGGACTSPNRSSAGGMPRTPRGPAAAVPPGSALPAGRPPVRGRSPVRPGARTVSPAPARAGGTAETDRGRTPRPAGSTPRRCACTGWTSPDRSTPSSGRRASAGTATVSPA